MGDTLVLGQVMATVPSEEENSVLLNSVVTADVGKFQVHPQNVFYQNIQN
jgi:hypothetical protein